MNLHRLSILLSLIVLMSIAARLFSFIECGGLLWPCEPCSVSYRLLRDYAGLPPYASHLSSTVHQHLVVNTTRSILNSRSSLAFTDSISVVLHFTYQAISVQSGMCCHLLPLVPTSSRRPPYAPRPQLVRQRPPGAHHNLTVAVPPSLLPQHSDRFELLITLDSA